MSAAYPPTVNNASAVGHMLKERVVKGIEQCGVEPASLLGEMENSMQMRRLLSSMPVLGIALQPLCFTLAIRSIYSYV